MFGRESRAVDAGRRFGGDASLGFVAGFGHKRRQPVERSPLVLLLRPRLLRANDNNARGRDASVVAGQQPLLDGRGETRAWDIELERHGRGCLVHMLAAWTTGTYGVPLQFVVVKANARRNMTRDAAHGCDLRGAIAVHAVIIGLAYEAALLQHVIEVRHGFAGRHDQVAVGDAALEQGRERVYGALRFAAQCA